MEIGGCNGYNRTKKLFRFDTCNR
ncbi:MAG: hypothetical protein IJ039_08120 [Clostridia bacterium]|nr:hypothetical protein [Clostridia bacterium]